MRGFNIQIDNLWYVSPSPPANSSQFLPQDKVASFALLSPSELLYETQRAAGGQDMIDNWIYLKERRNEERTLEIVLPAPRHS